MTGSRTTPTRRGLSLLEVILALAILGMAVAILGELVHMATRSAADARELTRAQLLCESKMAEIVLGVEPLQPLSFTPLQLDPDWLYAIDVQPSAFDPSLLVVRVTVQQDTQGVGVPVEYTLTRWMIDPTLTTTTEALTTETTTP